jgi:uncharacterized membrane protein
MDQPEPQPAIDKVETIRLRSRIPVDKIDTALLSAQPVIDKVDTTVLPAHQEIDKIVTTVLSAQPAVPAASASPYRKPKLNAIELGACSVLGVFALWLFQYRVQDLSLWYDETFSVSLAHQPWSIFLQAHEANMVLYTVLLHFWLGFLSVLGASPSPLVTRLPSILAMAIASVVVLLIGSRLWDLATGIVAGLLFVLNGIILTQAQTARGYALQTLFVCLSWCALFLALKEPASKRWWILYGVVTTLAIYIDLLSIFELAAQVIGIAVVLVPPILKRAEDFPALSSVTWRSVALRGGVAVVSTGVACIPLALDARIHHGNNSWVPIATPAAIGSFIMSQTANHIVPAIGLVFAGILGVILGLSVRRTLPVLLISWVLVPFAGQYLLTQPYLDMHLFFPKYLIATLPAFSLLAAIGLTGLRPYWVAICVTLLLLWQMIATPISYYPGWFSVSTVVTVLSVAPRRIVAFQQVIISGSYMPGRDYQRCSPVAGIGVTRARPLQHQTFWQATSKDVSTYLLSLWLPSPETLLPSKIVSWRLCVPWGLRWCRRIAPPHLDSRATSR